MYFLETVKIKITKEINKALNKSHFAETSQDGLEINVDDLVFPPDSKMGDISLPCFGLAKILGRSPAEVATKLMGEIKDQFCLVSTAGPYLNFTLNKAVLSDKVLQEVATKQGKYGEQKIGGKKKILVEYSNANTHKEYHVGHLRNLTYGDSVTKLLKANGFNSIPFSYINDFGIHVAKTIWALDKFHTKTKLPANKGYFLGKVYVEASRKQEELGDAAKTEIGEYMKAIESRSGAIYEKWVETRQWTIKSFDKIYKELGIKFKEIWYENEFIDEGLKLTKGLVSEGVLKESQGAVIADLEQFNFGVQVYLRADGTALYPVADLALAKAKFDRFGLDASIYVVDIRQGLHFKQLFKVLELMGYHQQMTHLGYDFVTLPGGMMSSRSGNVVTYEDLSADMMLNAMSSTKEKHPDWEINKVEEVAKKIAVGAMKFELIKVSREKTITFDIEKSLRFDGFTAAYLQYTGARINSILKKSAPAEVVDYSKLTESREYELVVKLAKYPNIVLEAGEKYEPSEVAKYLFELAQLFNDYYHAVPVLKAEKAVMEVRLVLLASVKQVLANGLNLLGVDFIEEM